MKNSEWTATRIAPILEVGPRNGVVVDIMAAQVIDINMTDRRGVRFKTLVMELVCRTMVTVAHP